MSDRAPESYRDCKRPPLHEALKLEEGTPQEAIASLQQKGYFDPPPRPWRLGKMDRGMGRASFAVLDRFDDLVVETSNNEALAQLIVDAVNAYIPQPL